MPDFCKNSSLLILVTGSVILTVILELMSEALLSIVSFALTGIYLLWLSLGSAALLCFLNTRANFKLSLSSGFLICILIWAVVDSLAQWFYVGEWQSHVFVKRGLSALLLLLVLFRIFALLEISNRRAQLETQNKLSLLQSKIAPHFLFNSLNTIAELAQISPDHAESSIHSLSVLLRATLDDQNHFHSAKDEMNLCEKYLQLEQWRLGERLSVEKNYDLEQLNDAIVPKLLIQPLIENCVIHGIEKSSGNGRVEITIKHNNDQLEVRISNTVTHLNNDESEGMGIAIDNIKERLFVIYDDQYKFTVDESESLYTVTMRMPLRPGNFHQT